MEDYCGQAPRWRTLRQFTSSSVEFARSGSTSLSSLSLSLLCTYYYYSAAVYYDV